MNTRSDELHISPDVSALSGARASDYRVIMIIENLVKILAISDRVAVCIFKNAMLCCIT